LFQVEVGRDPCDPAKFAYKRNNLLIENIDLFRTTLNKMAEKYNISIDAWVVHPDHFHLILSPAENILDDFMHDFKLSFGSLFRIMAGSQGSCPTITN